MATTKKKTAKTALNGAKPKKVAKKEIKTPWDLLMKFKDKPLFTIAKEDEDLIYGTNMMTRLMLEK